MGHETFFVLAVLISFSMAINVQCPVKRYIVILFQPVTLQCQYQTSDPNPPLITWKYKSYCRDPIEMALNPSSSENALAQANPNYDPVIECPDRDRTVHIVASKRIAVTLGTEYQGRRISIINNADLNIAQTAWGDSGVYFCSVASDQDLSGNGDCYTELIVLDKLLVALVVIGFFLLLLLIGVCWCQCCPHTCCCYVSCPCCPERCCCPRALYEAGRAYRKGVPSQYAPTVYAPSVFSQPVGGATPAIPMLPLPRDVEMIPASNFSRDYEQASSVGQGSQVPLLHDRDQACGPTRSGYRIQANQDGNPTRVLYYMERELANLDTSQSRDATTKYNQLDGISEVSSLHDKFENRSYGYSRPPQFELYDERDELMSTISSVSQHQNRDRDIRGPVSYGARGRAHSMDYLDAEYQWSEDRHRRNRDEPKNYRRGSDDRFDYTFSDSSDRSYQPQRNMHNNTNFHSPKKGRGFQGRRTRSRDDLMDLDGHDERYDEQLLQKALERKKMGLSPLPEGPYSGQRANMDFSGRQEIRRHHLPPPLPNSPPFGPSDHLPASYTAYDEESTASSMKSNLRKNGAVSRESLVV